VLEARHRIPTQDKANDAIQHGVDQQQGIGSGEPGSGGACRVGRQGAIDTSIVRMKGEHPVQQRALAV
jgi:hypothetical protein